MKLNKLRYKRRDHVSLDAEAPAKKGNHSSEQDVMLSASLAMAGQAGSSQHSRGRSCCRRDHACAPRATARAHHAAPGKTRSPWPIARRLPHRVIGIRNRQLSAKARRFPQRRAPKRLHREWSIGSVRNAAPRRSARTPSYGRSDSTPQRRLPAA